jgi:hypothetical protein
MRCSMTKDQREIQRKLQILRYAEEVSLQRRKDEESLAVRYGDCIEL